jgi:hypothetical protein
MVLLETHEVRIVPKQKRKSKYLQNDLVITPLISGKITKKIWKKEVGTVKKDFFLANAGEKE